MNVCLHMQRGLTTTESCIYIISPEECHFSWEAAATQPARRCSGTELPLSALPAAKRPPGKRSSDIESCTETLLMFSIF